ncbi:MAG: hypothetical protein FJX74_02985 [Armatimonadetes bacterium]|nr:hypothetical protein [Armatimonadota bacterium]
MLMAPAVWLSLLSALPIFAQPTPELTHYWGNLDGSWLFAIDPQEAGETTGWMDADFDDSAWRLLKAPGYWEAQGITDPRPGQPPKPKNGMPYTDYDGVAWYRKHFLVPRGWAGQEMILHLGSVDDYDRVYLNGELLGETPLGTHQAVSLLRSYRLPADKARAGEENVLAVQVRDGGGPGGLMGPLLTLLPTDIAEATSMLAQDDRPFAERFADPPASCRILKIVHSLPDRPTDQDMLFRSLISQGFGGVVCNVSFTDYLTSEEKWAAFARGVQEARKLGMALWLYDERGYPSGSAGGLTLRDHPEWEARGLLIAEADSTGGAVALDLPPGTLVSAAAYPLRDGAIDPDGAVDLAPNAREGKLVWEAPAGDWRVMAITEDVLYEGTHAAVSLADKLPYINLLDPAPTRRFIELTYGGYEKHLGSDLGEYFIASFTDEPSLMSSFMRPMPYKVLPWAPNLPGEFARRRGRALEPLVPALVADAGPGTAQARHDFWLTVGELVSEGFFGQIQEACGKLNLRSGGHLLAEEGLRNHVAFYGDFFRCARRLDAPSIDCLTSIPQQVPWQIARLMGSVADLEGKPYTMSETSDFAQRYRPAGDERPVVDVTEAQIRGTCNRELVGGINTITSYYSFQGLTGEELRRLNEWVGRCATALRGGHQVTDLAVVYPIESLWLRFTPARHGPTTSAAAAELDGIYNAVSNGLYTARRDFTYVDSRALAEARVEDGALVHGGLRWRVVVLPGVDTLPDEAWLNLRELWRQGGAVIAVGARPANSAREFPSPRIEQLGAEMLGTGDDLRLTVGEAGGVGAYLPRSAVALLPTVLDAIIEPDLAADAAGSPVRFTHRRIDGQEVYFAINDSPEPVEASVSLATAGAGELWDPATGKLTPLASGQGVKLALDSYGGALLRFGQARERERLRPRPGPLPGLTLAPLPPVEPAEGHGEFVQGGLSPDAEHSQPDAPAWRAVATLTKSEVDTHLFVSFRHPGPVDLSEAACLVLDTWAPHGQQTPSELLVLLHEAGGAIYLGRADRALSASGHARSFVLWSAFDLAGWTKDDNGRLDLDAVTAISVGWGGYFGQAGERIEFSLARPRVARSDGG